MNIRVAVEYGNDDRRVRREVSVEDMHPDYSERLLAEAFTAIKNDSGGGERQDRIAALEATVARLQRIVEERVEVR